MNHFINVVIVSPVPDLFCEWSDAGQLGANEEVLEVTDMIDMNACAFECTKSG